MNPTSSVDPSIQAAIGAMESTMQQFFHHLPNPFQRLIIPKILRMMKKRIQPRPILLVQGTGGGKSAVPQTCGCTSPGITIILENTQALGADQKGKLDNLDGNRIVAW